MALAIVLQMNSVMERQPEAPPAEATPVLSLGIDPVEPEVIEHSTPCIRCWYDLRSLSTRERCPECGTPVSRTLRSLFGSSPEHLSRLHTSIVWLESIALALFVIVTSWFLLTQSRGGGGRLHPMDHLLFLAVPLIVHVAPLLVRMCVAEGRVPRLERVRGARWRTHLSWSFSYAAALLFGIVALAMTIGARTDLRQTALWFAPVVTLLWFGRNLVLSFQVARLKKRLGLRPTAAVMWILPLLQSMALIVALASGMPNGRLSAVIPFYLAAMLVPFTASALLKPALDMPAAGP